MLKAKWFMYVSETDPVYSTRQNKQIFYCKKDFTKKTIGQMECEHS